MEMNDIFDKWRGGLIVSCQAPANSPLAKPEIIRAFAETAEQNGAVGVRIDSPAHIPAVKKTVKIPILGIYKIITDQSDVYITPTFDAAREIASRAPTLSPLTLLRAAVRMGKNSNRSCDKFALNCEKP